MKIKISLLFFFCSSVLFSQNADIHWLRCINETVHPQLDKTMRGVSNSVTPAIIAVPVGLFACEYFYHRYRINKPIAIGVSLASTAVITFGLKYTVNRDRPFVTYPDIIKRSDAGSKSFPSGHTSSAFALATSLSLEYPHWYVVAPAYMWACSVGYSRMRLGVHYPSDVAAGAVIGAGCAWATWWINKKIMEEMDLKRREHYKDGGN